MSYSKRVWKNQTLITNLTHNLSFASDEDINERLLLRYRNYDFLTPDPAANAAMLEDVIKSWTDQIKKLYETTMYEYDPLWNYDLKETGKIIDEKHKGNKTSTGINLTVTDTPRTERETDEYGYGYDTSESSPAPTGKTIERAPTGTDQRSTVGNAAQNYTQQEDISGTVFDKDVHTFDEYHKFGNVGVTATQDLIAKQREIIIDVIDIYIEKFADCFNISSCIAFEPFSESEV